MDRFWYWMCLNDRIDLLDKIGSFAAGCWWPKIELIFSYLCIHSFNPNFVVSQRKKSLGYHNSIKKNSIHFKQNWRLDICISIRSDKIIWPQGQIIFISPHIRSDNFYLTPNWVMKHLQFANCDMCDPKFAAGVNLRRYDTSMRTVMNVMRIFHLELS